MLSIQDIQTTIYMHSLHQPKFNQMQNLFAYSTVLLYTGFLWITYLCLARLYSIKFTFVRPKKSISFSRTMREKKYFSMMFTLPLKIYDRQIHFLSVDPLICVSQVVRNFFV